MRSIVIVDTSVLLNILDVPGRNQDRDAVLNRLGELIDTGDHLFIPMAAIVEVGSHHRPCRSVEIRLKCRFCTWQSPAWPTPWSPETPTC